jgi:hypothetical protein
MTPSLPETTIPKDAVGITVHFLGSVAIHQPSNGAPMPSLLCQYGSEIVLTADVIQANRDREGRWPLLDVLDDEATQVAMFGKRLIAPGPWPTNQPRYEAGSFEEDQAREEAHQAASSISDEQERGRALADVRARFGTRGRSTELQSYRR